MDTLMSVPTCQDFLTVKIGRNGTQVAKVDVSDIRVRTNFSVAHKLWAIFWMAYR
jgi:hypothetical protein